MQSEKYDFPYRDFRLGAKGTMQFSYINVYDSYSKRNCKLVFINISKCIFLSIKGHLQNQKIQTKWFLMVVGKLF